MSPDDLFKRPFPDENYVPPNEADLRKQALQKAYEIAKSITTDQAKAAEPKPAVDRGPLLRAVNAALAVLIAAWLFFAPPDWLPRPLSDGRTIEQRSLGLRVVLALEAARVRAYHEAEGKLPPSLVEVGGDLRGVRYVVIDDARFTLTATDGTASVTYDSTEPLADLLGGSGARR